MKYFCSFLLAGLLVGAVTTMSARAQTNDATAGQGGGGGGQRMQAMMAGLTPAQKQQYMEARKKALADNPQLAQEQKDLMAKRQAAQSADADPSAKTDLMQAMKTHMESMKAAMLKEDPTLQPVFDKMEANRQKAMQSAGGGSNGRPDGGLRRKNFDK